MHKIATVAAVTAILTSTGAVAGTPEIVQPLQLGAETLRFDHGDYIVDLPGQHAAVQVRPMAEDHDSLSFAIAVLNTGTAPFNIDTTNFRVEGAGEPVRLLSRDEMVQRAQHRAGWSKFFTRLGGAMVAAGYASQRNYATATVSTPYWTATATASAPCGSCQLAALAVAERTEQRVAMIQGSLDAARASYGEQALSLTTVYPGQTYAGRVYVAKFRHQPMAPLRLLGTIGDEAFAFGFRFAPAGTAAPAYHLAAAPPPLPVAAAAPVPAVVSAVAPLPAALPLRPVVATPAVARRYPGVGVGPEQVDRWQRYYAALVANGTSRQQARDMADEEIGSIG